MRFPVLYPNINTILALMICSWHSSNNIHSPVVRMLRSLACCQITFIQQYKLIHQIDLLFILYLDFTDCTDISKI